MIESPLARLTRRADRGDRRGFDAIHDEVFNSLGDRDANYIRNVIALHRQLALLVPRDPARLPLPARLGARDERAGHREDPREHGDRPQRPARPVGLDGGSADQLHHLGLGHGLHSGGVEALTQLRPSHVHQHSRQGQGPRLRDHARRPASAVASRVPAAAALQPRCSPRSSSGGWHCTTSTSRRSARARSRRSSSCTSCGASAARRGDSSLKDYVAFPAARRAAAASSARSRPTSPPT